MAKSYYEDTRDQRCNNSLNKIIAGTIEYQFNKL